MRFCAIVFATVLSMLASGASEAAITIERVTIVQGPPVLLLKGDFENSDDPQALKREVDLTGSRIVTFNSNGGNIAAAMSYGRLIRSLGLATMQMRAAQCASACALAFVGGKPRVAEPGSIGVHQSSFSPDTELSGPAAVAAVQAVTAQIMTYLIEMDVDPKLLQLSLSIPHDDMRYLTASEMRTFGVVSNDVSDQDGVGTATKIDPATPSASVATEDEPPAAETVEDKAISFLRRYNDDLSRHNARAMSSMAGSYAPTIEFYGRPTSRNEVMAEKLKFVERWPVRAYSLKPGSENATCEKTCKVTGVVDWFATTPSRDRSSSGSAEYSVVWDPVAEKIISENGKVLSTDKLETKPVRILEQWEDQNTACRGGSGNSQTTMTACERREEIGAKLKSVGWCFGKEGQAGYEMQWHACDGVGKPGSNAIALTRGPLPRPGDFAVSSTYSGKTKLPDFKGRDRDYNNFRTRIRDGMKGGANFAGQYSVIQIGCGTGCTFVIVANNRTGKPSSFPRGGEDNMYLSLSFRKSSRLLAAQWADYSTSKCYLEHFEFTRESWNPLSRIELGNMDMCYEDIDKNMQRH